MRLRTMFRASLWCLVLTFSPALQMAGSAMAEGPSSLSEPSAPEAYPQTVYAGVIANPVLPEMTMFAELMKLAFPKKALKSFFNTTAHTTILVPTNAAFETMLSSLTQPQRQLLLDPNTGLLETALRSHFTEGDWRLFEATYGFEGFHDPVGGLRMAADELINVLRDGNVLRANCAAIGESLVFENGMIHLIDTVLMPITAPRKVRCSPPINKSN